jgi:glyoxylase-like metal-dependent hydrolase (beta-lactamase superfamily II)
MNDWFTIEEIDKSTFAISEYKHWEQAHSYLLTGSKAAALIDTGLGIGNIKNIVSKLTCKPVQVITTHAHWDHIGGHHYFEAIGIHENDSQWLDGKFPLSIGTVKSLLLKNPCQFPDEFNINAYSLFQGKPSILLHDNDIVDLGDRKLRVIHTPGHSPGHICLFEEEKGYLFSGDLVYLGTLDAFYPSTNPKDFMDSIKKIRGLLIKRILPGHYSLDVPVSIAGEISEAFSQLYSQGKLAQGKGLFEFSNFNIHV